MVVQVLVVGGAFDGGKEACPQVTGAAPIYRYFGSSSSCLDHHISCVVM